MLRNYVARFLKTGPIRFFGVTVIVVVLALLVAALSTTRNGRTGLGSNLGADFAQFYVAGSIFNNHSSEVLYDIELQHRLYRGLFPEEPDASLLPYFYPPYIAVIVSPLSRLSYRTAYLVWLGFGMALYLGGLILLGRRLQFISREDRVTAVLVSVSFAPFLLESWVGGQLSAWGFFLIASALCADHLKRPLLSGLALSLCSYKPTLLVLILPMLLLTRRWKMLAALGAGVLAIAGFSLILVGAQTNREYARSVIGYGRLVTEGVVALRLWKYIDINSFVTLLVGHGSVRLPMVGIMVGAVLLTLMIVAIEIWKRPADSDPDIVWALALCWTLILNVYTPLYDSVLLVPAVLLTYNAYRRGSLRSASALNWLLPLLYIIPLVTQAVARAIGVQVYTLIVGAFGIYLINSRDRGRLVSEAGMSGSAEELSR